LGFLVFGFVRVMTEVPRFPLSPFLSLSFCIRIGLAIIFYHSSIIPVGLGGVITHRIFELLT
jgi:hypothetical protein